MGNSWATWNTFGRFQPMVGRIRPIPGDLDQVWVAFRRCWSLLAPTLVRVRPPPCYFGHFRLCGQIRELSANCRLEFDDFRAISVGHPRWKAQRDSVGCLCWGSPVVGPKFDSPEVSPNMSARGSDLHDAASKSGVGHEVAFESTGPTARTETEDRPTPSHPPTTWPPTTADRLPGASTELGPGSGQIESLPAFDASTRQDVTRHATSRPIHHNVLHPENLHKHRPEHVWANIAQSHPYGKVRKQLFGNLRVT